MNQSSAARKEFAASMSDADHLGIYNVKTFFTCNYMKANAK
jgi:hypothetical protein